MTESTEVREPGVTFEKVPGSIANGVFTCIGPKGHRTIKVSTIQKGVLVGRRKVSVMTGPDNLFSYTAVAFFNTDENGVDSVKIWKRMEGTQLHKIVDAWFQMMKIPTDPVMAEKWKGYRVEEARNCIVCNLLLTSPESIAAGIGPICRGSQ